MKKNEKQEQFGKNSRIINTGYNCTKSCAKIRFHDSGPFEKITDIGMKITSTAAAAAKN